MRSGTISNASETGSTVGRRIAKHEERDERDACGSCAAESEVSTRRRTSAEDEDRHEEREPAGEQGHRGEGVVVARADLDVVQLVVVRREEVEGAREHDRVHERDAGDEERGRQDDEHEDDALEVRLDRRREERPGLPEQDRETRRRAPRSS